MQETAPKQPSGFEMVSENTLRKSLLARVRELGKLGPMVSGSFVKTSRKCGRKGCPCANGGEKHPIFLLTRKVDGKTHSSYVPVDMADEVAQWAQNHRRLRELLREIDEIALHILSIHVKCRRARKANQQHSDTEQ